MRTTFPGWDCLGLPVLTWREISDVCGLHHNWNPTFFDLVSFFLLQFLSKLLDSHKKEEDSVLWSEDCSNFNPSVMAKLTSLELYTFTMVFGKTKLEVVLFDADKAGSLKHCMALSNLICRPILVLVTTYFHVSWIWRNNVFSHFEQVIRFLHLFAFLFSLELFKRYWLTTIISAACTFYVMY